MNGVTRLQGTLRPSRSRTRRFHLLDLSFGHRDLYALAADGLWPSPGCPASGERGTKPRGKARFSPGICSPFPKPQAEDPLALRFAAGAHCYVAVGIPHRHARVQGGHRPGAGLGRTAPSPRTAPAKTLKKLAFSPWEGTIEVINRKGRNPWTGFR